ncbi:hypothetical protein PAEPH01_1369 [Pancytospora epiphaga]|nr:hypothetical protein PAEPH01_1369 [Pancytospora epiphaga]
MEQLLNKLRSLDNMEEVKEGIIEIQKYNGPNIESIVDGLYYLIWSTPGFKQQVFLVDFIIEHLGKDIHRLLFAFIISRFNKIKADRRDKFYYFIERSLGLLSFKEILEISDDDVLEHICRCLNKSKPADWDDVIFLEFIATCKPWLCKMFQDIIIDERTVRPYLVRHMGRENRDAMYRFFKG